MSAIVRGWGGKESPDAFENLLAPHIEHLYHLAYRFTANVAAAEDLVQDVLIKIFAKYEAFKAYEKPGPWMARVLYNEYIDSWRRSRLQPSTLSSLGDAELQSVESLADESWSASPLRQVANIELGHRLIAGLARLNADHRAILVLHDVEEYTLEEIAAIACLPVGTCKSRVFRARARLREVLGKTMSHWIDDEPAASFS